MLTYEKLRRNPKLFEKLTGRTVTEFNDLCLKLEPAYRESEKSRLSRPGLSETQFKHALRSRLLMTLLWLIHPLTYQALGKLFSLHRTSVSYDVKIALKVLKRVGEIEEIPKRVGEMHLEELASRFPPLLEVMGEGEGIELKLEVAEEGSGGPVHVNGRREPADEGIPVKIVGEKEKGLPVALREKEYNYDQLISTLQDYFLNSDVPIPSWNASDDEKEGFKYAALRALVKLSTGVRDEDLQDVAREASARMLGLGVLEPFLEMDGVEEVVVRGGHVQVYQYGRWRDMGDPASEEYFKQLAYKVADFGGKELTAAKPKVVVNIPGGSRFAAMVPPLSTEGTAINIRKFGVRSLTLDDLLRGPVINPRTGERTAPAFDEETRDFLIETAEKMDMSILFSGRPGAGKTTLLNAFSAHLPDYAQVCVAETFIELDLACPHLARAVVTEDMEERGKITMDDVVNTLYTRMRPDVLILGEVVGAEAREYLTAINLGVVAHTTIHGNSALDALHRLESLAMEKGTPLLATQEKIARGVNLAVHLNVSPKGERYLGEMALVKGLEVKWETGHYKLDVIKRRNGDGTYTPLSL